MGWLAEWLLLLFMLMLLLLCSCACSYLVWLLPCCSCPPCALWLLVRCALRSLLLLLPRQPPGSPGRPKGGYFMHVLCAAGLGKKWAVASTHI